jgi:uncharacterized protein (TIGR02444 family)
MSEPSAQGSPFWRFSLAFYRRPKVAEACIALQEEAGADVNLLLFLLWHATQARSLSRTEVADLEGRVAPWRDTAVVPLRAVRRALKAPAGIVAPPTAEAFRTRIKAAELEAERLQQEAMYELVNAGPLGRAVGNAGEAARANIEVYQSICRAAFPRPAVETLLAALRGPEQQREE